jgi:hypothetical protein
MMKKISKPRSREWGADCIKRKSSPSEELSNILYDIVKPDLTYLFPTYVSGWSWHLV